MSQAHEIRYRRLWYLPRITISGLRGGSGKTILSVGLTAALSKAGEIVIPFKKGPDYIDAGWLGLAAGKPCHNLDTFLVDPHTTIASFVSHAKYDGISVIEGNRGLFDSIDPEGTTSTAELAKLLVPPLVLIVDCTKSTRTIAALVMGCSHFDPDVDLRAVVLNNVAGSRHESKLRKNIEKYTGISVVGAIPKLTSEELFPKDTWGLFPRRNTHGPRTPWTRQAISPPNMLICPKSWKSHALQWLPFQGLTNFPWGRPSLPWAVNAPGSVLLRIRLFSFTILKTSRLWKKLELTW